MPEIPIITIDVDGFRTKKQQKLLQMLNDKNVRTEINIRIKDAINPFVPKKSGALRASAKVYPDYISWGENLKQYARYQYYGEVYGPNLPGVIGGGPAWRSRKGKRKHPTGRELGVKGSATLRPLWGDTKPLPLSMKYKFGYTTRGTHHHWDKYFRFIPKMKANLEITRYLKRECKKRGLKT